MALSLSRDICVYRYRYIQDALTYFWLNSVSYIGGVQIFFSKSFIAKRDI